MCCPETTWEWWSHLLWSTDRSSLLQNMRHSHLCTCPGWAPGVPWKLCHQMLPLSPDENAWSRHGDPMGTPLSPHGNPMESAWRPHGDPMGTPWSPHGDPMESPWRRHGVHRGTPWESAWSVPMRTSRGSQGNLWEFPWGVNGVHMGRPWGPMGTS